MSAADELVAMTRRESPARDALATALAKAQAAIRTAAKDASNPHFGSKYADLASVWDAVRAPLTDNGLSVVQEPCGDGERVGLTTTLMHASGQFMTSTVFALAERKGPQAVGSVITYLRRYALAAVVGVAPDDDDGNAGEAEKPAQAPQRRAPQVAAAMRPANDNGRAPAAASPARPAGPPPAQDGQPAASSSAKPTLKAMRQYHALREEMGVSEDDARARVSTLLGREVASMNDITAAEMTRVILKMEQAGNASA